VSANRDRAEAERHWRKVYAGRASDALGWHQERPVLSLAMIEATGFGPAAFSLVETRAESQTTPGGVVQIFNIAASPIC